MSPREPRHRLTCFMNPPVTSLPLIQPGKVRVGVVLVLVCAGCSSAASSSMETQGPVPADDRAGAIRRQLVLREPYAIRITGSNKRWRVQYPGTVGSELLA